MARTGTFWEGQTAPKMLLKQGLNLPQPRYNPRILVFKSSGCAPLSAGNCLRSAVQGRNSEANHPKEGQTAQVSANWRFLEFSRRAGTS